MLILKILTQLRLCQTNKAFKQDVTKPAQQYSLQYSQQYSQFLWGNRPGGTPIWKGRGCSSEILNLTPKRDQSGRGRSLCRPLKETLFI